MSVTSNNSSQSSEYKKLRRRRNTVLSLCLLACLGVLINFASEIFPAQAIEPEIEMTEVLEYDTEEEIVNYLGEETTGRSLLSQELGMGDA